MICFRTCISITDFKVDHISGLPWVKSLFLLILLSACGIGDALYAGVEAVQLQCEFRDDPIGLDETSPRLSWIPTSSGNQKSQEAYHILVASSREKLDLEIGDLWDSGKIPSGSSVNIRYGGTSLGAFQVCFWKVRLWDDAGQLSDWSESAQFTIGPLNSLDWSADWISSARNADSSNFPWLRKTFDLDDVPATAYAHINVMGYFELHVNGKKVGDDILSPAVSDYSRQTLFVTYNITPYLREGKNCIGLWIAHGWYRHDDIDYFGVTEDRPLARALFEFRDMDGQNAFISTDRTWKYHLSNRSYAGSWYWGHFGGESVETGKMNHAWSHANLDDTDWMQVDNYIPPAIPARAQRNNATKIMDTLRVRDILPVGENAFLVDFGKHINGLVEIDFPKNNVRTEVRVDYIDKLLRPGEEWDPLENSFAQIIHGDPQGRSMITYNQRDVIYADSGFPARFKSRFNHHAFRWVLLSGIENVQAENLKAYMIGEDMKQVTRFESSNPLLNRIWETVNHTYRCIAYNGYVVDCPQRERAGYGGDSHSSMETALSNFDMAALYNKWTVDWNEGMYGSGLWPHTVPHLPSHKNKFSPGWGGFGMFMPWQFYIYYGDTLNLSRAYPYIRKWIDYMHTNTRDGILYPDTSRGDSQAWSFHGDWVAPPYGMQQNRRVDQNSTHLFNNCYYLYNLRLASSIADVLGSSEDAQIYRDRYEFSRESIHNKFYNPETGDYANGEQPYQAFPLYVDLVPAEPKEDLDKKLEFLILEKNKGHLNTGMLGTYFMFEYLLESGRNDLIYTMVNQKSFPGWGYMIEQGATTIWEQWNGQNSQIHNCYLAVGKWFVQGLGGIRPDPEHPGFSHFYIIPGIVDGMDYAKVSYTTRKGEILSKWEKQNGSLTFEVQVPCNTTATFVLPDIGNRKVVLNGKSIKKLDHCEVFAGMSIPLMPGSHRVEIK